MEIVDDRIGSMISSTIQLDDGVFLPPWPLKIEQGEEVGEE